MAQQQSSTEIAERRILREATPIIGEYMSRRINFDELMNRLAQIDDAKHYEMAAAEEVGE